MKGRKKSEDIRKRIFGKKGKPIDLTRIHHRLMKAYGWIPIEEFKRMKIPTVMILLTHIIEDEEAEARAIRKASRGAGGKRLHA